MTWVRLDDNIFGNSKIVEVSGPAKLLHIVGICFCAQGLTDGFIPAKALRQLHAIANSGPRHVDELTNADLWHDSDGGFWVHDYLEYNPTREKVLGDREAARVRMNKHRTSGEVRRPRPVPTPVTPISPSLKAVDNPKRHFLPGSGWVEEA